MPTTRAERLREAINNALAMAFSMTDPAALTAIGDGLFAALAAADPTPAGADPFRFLVESYDRRRREVAAMIEEADASTDDGSAGPDALADALMEVAEGWCRSALSAAPAGAGDRETGTCWFCKGTFSVDALIAGYDTFEEQRLACLACNERMSGNWRPSSTPPEAAAAKAGLGEAAGLDVERLARATFLSRTSSNVPLPDDYWERQSPQMREPFLLEAQAVAAVYSRLHPRPTDSEAPE